MGQNVGFSGILVNGESRLRAFWVGEGILGVELIRRPGGNRGRGSEGAWQLDVRVPCPHQLCPCAHALREGGELRSASVRSPLGIVVLT